MPGPCGRPEVCQGGAGLLQYLYDKPVCLHEMAKGTFYPFIALLSATSNHSEELKYFYRCSWLIKFRGSSLCWIVLSEVFNIFDKKYQRTFSSHQMPFHYSSFDKHSSLSKHDKSRVFWHIRVDDIYETENQNIVCCIIGIRNMAGEFQAHVEDWDVLHKESSVPFLFTICMLRSTFCWDISVEHEFDRCAEI